MAVVVSLFNKGNRITPKRFVEALAAGAQGTIAVAAAGGLLLIDPGEITDVIGISLILIVFVWQLLQKKQIFKKSAAA